MTCTETRDLFSALADDALTPAERAALDAHLAGCAECRRELAGLLRTVKLVRAIDPERAPAGFVDRVLAAARPERRPKRLARRLLASWPKLPLGAAALFLVAGLAVLLFRGSSEQQQAARYQAPTPAPAAQAPTRETAPSTGPPAPTAAPRETGSSATTATLESAPAAPPARSRELETANNRVEQPAPSEQRAETTAEPGSPPRDAAPAAPRTMAERQVAAPPAAPEERRAKVDASERAQAPAGERFSSRAEDARADVAKDAAKEGKLRQEPPASTPPPVGAAGVVPSVAAKSQVTRQIAPFSLTGPRTGIPATPPDVSAQLRVPDVTAAELSLIELAARVGGRQTGRRIDGGRVVVELAVPREAYAQFVREASALGPLVIERQATERPMLAVTVTVSN
jgi:anti-sigma factor RsiW